MWREVVVQDTPLLKDISLTWDSDQALTLCICHQRNYQRLNSNRNNLEIARYLPKHCHSPWECIVLLGSIWTPILNLNSRGQQKHRYDLWFKKYELNENFSWNIPMITFLIWSSSENSSMRISLKWSASTLILFFSRV